MRADVTPRRVDVLPGQPASISLTVTNTSTVIGGYAVRVLGADPGWVELDGDEISLFPDETRTVEVAVTVPEGIGAGTRRIAVQVRELTPPEDSTVVEVDLVVPSAPSVQMRVDPLSVTAGHSGAFSLVITNTGNTSIDRQLGGVDTEGKVKFKFAPATVALHPGEHAVVDVRASARRRILGSPAVRILSFFLDEPAPVGAAPATAAREDHEALASASLIQRPVISRGGLALVGLLAAITVFGLVITLALGKLVGQSAADRDLALQLAQAGDSSASTGTSSVSGTVGLLTSGQPVPGVSVAVYAADDATTPLTTTATDANGAYSVDHLAAGDYKISYRGAGFIQLWYPGATTDADAKSVTLGAGEDRQGLDVRLGGVPATISGEVAGEDVAGATLTLETTPILTATGAAGGPGSPAESDPTVGAVVQTVTVATDGTFEMADVPSPSIYTIEVTKPGYATSTQRIDIGAGESRKGVDIMLRKGDGLISGMVTSSGGPVRQATITATAGEASANTVSLTEGHVGSFTLRGLPTPSTVTLTVSKPGFASQTLTVTLARGQKLTGVSIALSRSSGSLAGTVSLLPGHHPAPGVLVTVTNGSLTVSTQTESTGDVGSWRTGGLPVPGTYTVTFSRGDLVSQTVSVSLDEGGHITAGSYGAQISDSGIAVDMQSATATVHGKVTQRQSGNGGGGTDPVGEATVQFSSGSSTYTMTTASTPSSSVGRFRVEQLPPGTYTVSVSRRGTSPTSTILNLRAGQRLVYDPVLAAPASIAGTVVGTGGKARADWIVQLYVASQYPTVVAASTKTKADGSFAFENIDAPQAYVLVARPTSGSAPAGSVTAQIKASEQRSVKIKADPSD